MLPLPPANVYLIPPRSPAFAFSFCSRKLAECFAADRYIISGMVWVYNVQFSQDSTLVSNVKTYERYSCDPNMTRKHTHRNLFMILCKVGARILTYTSLHLSFFVFQTFGLSIATKNTLTTMSLYDITKKTLLLSILLIHSMYGIFLHIFTYIWLIFVW